MADLSRRHFIAGAAAVAATASAGLPAVHAQKRGGTMRFVPHADLKVLDPIWTTAYITRNHCYLIYDTLFRHRPESADQAADGRQVVLGEQGDEVVVHAA